MDALTWWQVVAVPALGPLTLALWQAYKWWATRADRKLASSMSAADRRDAAAAAERAALSSEMREMFARMERETIAAREGEERERSRRYAIERDRDRGWDLARMCFRYWSDVCHRLKNDRLLAMMLMRRTDTPDAEIDWKPFQDAPLDLETLIPREPK